MANEIEFAFHGQYFRTASKTILAVLPFAVAWGYFAWTQALAEVGVHGASGVPERYLALGFLQLLLAGFTLFVIAMASSLLRTTKRGRRWKAVLTLLVGGGISWAAYLVVLDSWGAIEGGWYNTGEAIGFGLVAVPFAWAVSWLVDWFFRQASDRYRAEATHRLVLTVPTVVSLMTVATSFPIAFVDQVPVAFGGVDVGLAAVQVVNGTTLATLDSPVQLANDTFALLVNYIDEDTVFVQVSTLDGLASGPITELAKSSVVAIRWIEVKSN